MGTLLVRALEAPAMLPQEPINNATAQVATRLARVRLAYFAQSAMTTSRRCRHRHLRWSDDLTLSTPSTSLRCDRVNHCRTARSTSSPSLRSRRETTSPP
jgi:hypothetical protein